MTFREIYVDICDHYVYCHYLCLLTPTIILCACLCGGIQIVDISDKKKKWSLKETFIDDEEREIWSVASLSERNVAIANNDDEIKIWQYSI